MKNEFYNWMVETKGKARTTVIPLPEGWKFFTLIHFTMKWVRRHIPPSITGMLDVLMGSNLPSTGTYSISGDTVQAVRWMEKDFWNWRRTGFRE
jgi:hypothetical protein